MIERLHYFPTSIISLYIITGNKITKHNKDDITDYWFSMKEYTPFA